MQCTHCVDPTGSRMIGWTKSYYRLQPPAVTIAHLAELKEKFVATW